MSSPMTEHPRIAQRRLASAGDKLGQWLEEAATGWEAHGTVADGGCGSGSRRNRALQLAPQGPKGDPRARTVRENSTMPGPREIRGFQDRSPPAGEGLSGQLSGNHVAETPTGFDDRPKCRIQI